MDEPPRATEAFGPTAMANRYARTITWCSVAVIVVSVALILRRVPIGPALQAWGDWVEGLGVWGPVVFGLLYVVAVVLLVPGSALTLAAGALFGLVTGTVTVSLASTTGAALAFLISRYLARGRIAAWLQSHRKFRALDQAIAENGWKIVVLLRLSPAVPFNLQNYLYGLTGIRFWTYVLASWLAMLPGSLLYVYLGQVGRVGLEAATGAERSRTVSERALLGLGLLATIALTVYVTRLARKALRQGTDLESGAGTSADQPTRRVAAAGWPWRATVAVLFALAILAVAVIAQFSTGGVKP